MPTFAPSLSTPAVIQPRSVPLSGPDDEFVWRLTPQNLADAMGVFGRAFAPTRLEQRNACKTARWMHWPSNLPETHFEKLWMDPLTTYHGMLWEVFMYCMERLAFPILAERVEHATRTYCQMASHEALDKLLGWIEETSGPPGTTPGCLLKIAEDEWTLGGFPMGMETMARLRQTTLGEWRRALACEMQPVADRPWTSNDARDHIRRVVQEDVEKRMHRLPAAMGEATRRRL